MRTRMRLKSFSHGPPLEKYLSIVQKVSTETHVAKRKIIIFVFRFLTAQKNTQRDVINNMLPIIKRKDDDIDKELR